MNDCFHLVDLISQAVAVEAILAGRSPSEKIEWIASRGKVEAVPQAIAGATQTYCFESSMGLKCAFFFSKDKLVFVGDHMTFTRSQ